MTGEQIILAVVIVLLIGGGFAYFTFLALWYLSLLWFERGGYITEEHNE